MVVNYEDRNGEHRSADCYTLGQLAKYCGKTIHTFRYYQKSGYLPYATLSIAVEIGGQPKNQQLFTKQLAVDLKPILTEVVSGKPFPASAKSDILNLFAEEKKFLNL